MILSELWNDKKIKILSILLLLVLCWKWLPYIFWFVVMLAVVVFVHEFGHFIVARYFGVKVEVFSIGFGHEIYGWNDKYGTRWKIAWLPLGGYVKMFGDSDPASSPDFDKLETYAELEKQQAFHFKKLYQKALVVFAGPAFNYLLAIVVLGMLYFVNGKGYISNEIAAIQDNMPAAEAGLEVGDKIIEVDGVTVDSFQQIQSLVAINLGEPINMLVQHNGVTRSVSITPELVEKKDAFGTVVKVGVIGVAAGKVEHIKFGAFGALTAAVSDTYRISATMLKAIGQIFSGSRSLDQLGGPIKIAQYSEESAKLGVNAFLWFIAIISINLGLVNLIPIPMLDGGHLMYYAIQGVTGREIPAKIQMVAMKIGFCLLMMLMLYVTFHDVKGLLK